MKKIVFVNQKGGTGKSTLSYNIAHYLAEQDKRVLFIDGDEQANASKSLAAYTAPNLAASSLFSESPISLPVLPQQIVLLRGDSTLRKIEQSDQDDEELVKLRARLAEISDGFDYAVIDTAGANSRVANALVVAGDFAVLPCRIDPYSIDVATQVLKRISFIQKSWNPGLVNLGILPNEYDATSPAQVEWLKQLIGAYRQFVMGAYVSKRSAFREASGDGVPVWRLESEADEDGGKGRVKTAARSAGKEVKAVFKIMQERMENAHG
ncbi:ParA family protein [Xanthomonas fragariae]